MARCKTAYTLASSTTFLTDRKDIRKGEMGQQAIAAQLQPISAAASLAEPPPLRCGGYSTLGSMAGDATPFYDATWLLKVIFFEAMPIHLVVDTQHTHTIKAPPPSFPHSGLRVGLLPAEAVRVSGQAAVELRQGLC